MLLMKSEKSMVQLHTHTHTQHGLNVIKITEEMHIYAPLLKTSPKMLRLYHAEVFAYFHFLSYSFLYFQSSAY